MLKQTKQTILKNRIENFFTKEALSATGLIDIKRLGGTLFHEFKGCYFISFKTMADLLDYKIWLRERELFRGRLNRDSIVKELSFCFSASGDRIKAARTVGLDGYANLTSSLRLYTPECFEYILLSRHGKNSPNKIGRAYEKSLFDQFTAFAAEHPKAVIDTINTLKNHESSELSLPFTI